MSEESNVVGEVVAYAPPQSNVSSGEIERRLAAILAADVEGSSRLMGADEDGTLETLNTCRNLIDSLIAKYHGHFVGSTGDSVLGEFASAIDAVNSAYEIP